MVTWVGAANIRPAAKEKDPPNREVERSRFAFYIYLYLLYMYMSRNSARKTTRRKPRRRGRRSRHAGSPTTAIVPDATEDEVVEALRECHSSNQAIRQHITEISKELHKAEASLVICKQKLSEAGVELAAAGDFSHGLDQTEWYDLDADDSDNWSWPSPSTDPRFA